VRCDELQVLLPQDRLPVDATHSLLLKSAACLLSF
jgi:hypothetical protein